MSRNPAIRQGILSAYATLRGPRTVRSVKLAIDTGATYTMVPPDLLYDIGYDPTKTTRRLELSTVTGLVLAPVIRIQRVSCLGFSLTDVEVVAHHLPPESPVEGLLGLNVLAHFTPFQAFYQTIQPFLA